MWTFYDAVQFVYENFSPQLDYPLKLLLTARIGVGGTCSHALQRRHWRCGRALNDTRYQLVNMLTDAIEPCSRR